MEKNAKNTIGYYLTRKEIDEREYSDVKKLLENFKQSDIVYFLTNSVKLEIKYQNFDQASEYLEELEGIAPNSLFVNYNYYKISCFRENYADAYLSLYKCYELSNGKCNITLPLTMLEMLLDIKHDYDLFSNTNYSNESINKHIFTSLDDEKINDRYNEVANCVYKKHFPLALIKLRELDRLAAKKNFPLEVGTLMKMTNQLIYEQAGIMLKSDETCLEILKSAGELPEREFNKFIYELSNSDPFSAKELLNIYANKISHHKMKKVLQNRIDENIYRICLPEEKQKAYNDNYRAAKKALKNKDYTDAFTCFLHGYQATGSITFIYYMGKTLYKAKNYTGTLKYLLNYVSQGGTKYEKACLYLANAYSYLGKDKKKQKYGEETEFINRQLNKKFKVYECCPKEKPSVGDQDFAFLFEEEVLDSNYQEEFSIIRNLYGSGKVKEADKMLNELNHSTEVDKEKVKQLRKNRTLYINKNKYKA